MLNRPSLSFAVSLSLHGLILLILLYSASRTNVDVPSFATVEISALAQLPQGLQPKMSVKPDKPEDPLIKPKPIPQKIESKKEESKHIATKVAPKNGKQPAAVSDPSNYDYKIPVSKKDKPQPIKNKPADVKKTVKKMPAVTKAVDAKGASRSAQEVKKTPKEPPVKSDTKELMDILDEALGEYADSAPAASPFGNIDELSGDERSIIKHKIESAWYASIPMTESENFRVELLIRLNERGRVLDVKILNTKCPNNLNCRALVAAAERAVYDASPFDNLPLERYYIWQEIQLNFDPSNTL